MSNADHHIPDQRFKLLVLKSLMFIIRLQLVKWPEGSVSNSGLYQDALDHVGDIYRQPGMREGK
jgi:hypothetical protein